MIERQSFGSFKSFLEKFGIYFEVKIYTKNQYFAYFDRQSDGLL